ncbi:MAG TPA: AMP-binding protein [Solirubrobacteraceae bacterium]|nr:AMP-binding protein [Solirubrobacteraceae bacterium]
MNFARDVIDAAPPGRLALVEIDRAGSRREMTFGEISEASARWAGALAARGVRRGDVVLTLIGNRPQWVLTMVACFRIGAVVLACSEQLRAGDLRARLQAARPRAIVADERNLGELEGALAALPADETARTALILVGAQGSAAAAARASAPPRRPAWREPEDERALWAGTPAAPVELEPTDPCLVTFTSGTTGEPKGVVHGQRYLTGQRLQASHWLGARPGELVWCTAATGWSKSARNAFIAPWLSGAAALVHDARFDPHERLEILEREGVNVLCMAPTEYRVIAKRARLRPLPALRGLVAAGEALNPEVLQAFREATGLEIRDGYGQTETGQLTGVPADGRVRPGSMGRALPGVRLEVRDGELVLADPRTDPTFFIGWLDGPPAPEDRPWHTGDRVTMDEDGYLYFEGRADDVIISAGYRIGPFEVESALVSHHAVAEAAVVAAPDDERGAVVRAVVVLREGHAPSDELAAELQDHVKRQTAPYKYPRIVEFASELPKTSSGKVRRALLRERARSQ